mmetsp:Transcript_9493/g.24072  ORF Transcript_9493/g.24072 Transcript_9493/m.24072 type:complete len:282 (-) Transcript_9493:86-931(-)
MRPSWNRRCSECARRRCGTRATRPSRTCQTTPPLSSPATSTTSGCATRARRCTHTSDLRRTNRAWRAYLRASSASWPSTSSTTPTPTPSAWTPCTSSARRRRPWAATATSPPGTMSSTRARTSSACSGPTGNTCQGRRCCAMTRSSRLSISSSMSGRQSSGTRTARPSHRGTTDCTGAQLSGPLSRATPGPALRGCRARARAPPPRTRAWSGAPSAPATTSKSTATWCRATCLRWWGSTTWRSWRAACGESRSWRPGRRGWRPRSTRESAGTPSCSTRSTA